jgi:hypothetical protein
VDHSFRPVSSQIPQGFWRSAAVVAMLVAAVELVLLVVTGSALLLRHGDPKPTRAAGASKSAAAAPTHAKAATRTPSRATSHVAAAKLARGKVDVMVLNGNGRHGAAAAAATRIRHHGYRIGFVGNAARMSYSRSLVMVRRGYEGEGRRFARDLGIRSVGPLDGMRPAQLHGAHVILIIGA